ncbi:MAG: deoxyguanosinetriphosphate triphosphohydrolase [Desulfomonile sp.]|nr:deoxyguanosinetriphosphate triphosphohydrolase [Deltaproteobacteria bacterium]
MIIRRSVQEQRERSFLAPYAILSENTKGRVYPENECPFRTAFQRDRDRIIHSKAFRRLEYKTQVFAYYEGDHYRTRLTHTLEAAQIARSVAQYLGANDDLTHAVALAHDLGHTPFGHAGEHALHDLMEDHGGFEHNCQSLRVVDILEARYPDFPGLNLTYETRCGIIRHATVYDTPSPDAAIEFMSEPQPSLEAQIVNVADEIAYNCHDIEDGLSSGFFDEQDLSELYLWTEVTRIIRDRHPDLDRDTFRYQCIRALIDTFIRDLVAQTDNAMSVENFLKPSAIAEAELPVVNFSQKMNTWKEDLNKFLHTRFYTHHKILRMQYKAYRLLRDLFEEYIERPPQLPPGVQKRIKEGRESLPRIVTDYIAGMTDRFALDEHRKLFLPYEY